MTAREVLDQIERDAMRGYGPVQTGTHLHFDSVRVPVVHFDGLMAALRAVLDPKLILRVCIGNVRYADVQMGYDTEVLARKPRSYAPPTTAQFSQMRPVTLSPVVMPPFTGGRQIGDPLARPA